MDALILLPIWGKKLAKPHPPVGLKIPTCQLNPSVQTNTSKCWCGLIQRSPWLGLARWPLIWFSAHGHIQRGSRCGLLCGSFGCFIVNTNNLNMDFLLLVRTQNIWFVKLLFLMVSIGDTPLKYALGAGNLDIVRYLLDHDADPEKPGEHERPLSMWQLEQVPAIHVYMRYFFLFILLCAHVTTYVSICQRVLVGCQLWNLPLSLFFYLFLLTSLHFLKFHFGYYFFNMVSICTDEIIPL